MTSILGLIKKTVAVFMAGMFMFSMVLPAQANALEVNHYKGTVTLDGTPKRVVVLGLSSLDILDNLGIQPVGTPQGLLPDYLKKYENSSTNVGSLKEPDYETIYTLKPDIIIAETRMLRLYDDLSKIAPTVMLYPMDGHYWEDTQKNWRMLGKLFNREEQVETLIQKTGSELETLHSQVQAARLNAMMVMNNGGNIAMYDKDSRFSLVFHEFGFAEAFPSEEETKGLKATKGAHGNLVSFEYIAATAPDVMFVLDRDQAIGNANGNARTAFNNPLVNATPAAKNHKIVFVNPGAWYITSGGVTGTANIIADIRKALN
ncbi:siderophore ABC transporter substrate-binding protein [Endozoicomonas elysicola]|uniref:siderophore ABC transporter substrate-binding protein n=1 Tax=Endozoicomonas elysicola TaxID=305900 RepID=UPI00037B4DF1|nr:ABC transporter substrate-binding protein [Endozoicomonas elysicola]